MIKGIERLAPMLHLEFRGVEVRLHGVRQDSPPFMSSITYDLIVDTDEDDRRLELLHQNVRKYGTISNTVAAATKLEGKIVRPKLFECDPRPMRLRRRQPTERHTHGLGRATIPADLANGIALLIGVGAIVREPIERISAPEPMAAATVLWLAAIEIAGVVDLHDLHILALSTTFNALTVHLVMLVDVRTDCSRSRNSVWHCARNAPRSSVEWKQNVGWADPARP